jgi:hypothetical protein
MHNLLAVIRSTNWRGATASTQHGLACIIALLAADPLVARADGELRAARQIGEFTLFDVDGARHTRDEYRAKNGVVLFFWGPSARFQMVTRPTCIALARSTPGGM